MSIFSKGARHFFEHLARFEVVRKEAKVMSSIEYIIQRRRIFEDFSINLVLDVGANTGQFAQKLRASYKGELISFEPVSTAFDSLAKTTSYDSRWKSYKLALGSQNSTQRINVSDYTDFSSFLKTNEYCRSHFGAGSIRVAEEVVSVRRLDEVLEEVVQDFNNKRIFLKMDTQGYDLEVFKGLGNKLKYVVALQSEVSVIPIYKEMPHWTECISFYERAGFGVTGFFPVTIDSCRVIEFDCLMVRVQP
jgi:FkbM family methyltransferase